MELKYTEGLAALDELVKAGDVARYDRYRGMSGDLLYLILPSGRELHLEATMLEGYSLLRVKVPA